MENFVQENKNGQALYSEIHQVEKVKDESKGYLSEIKCEIDEKKRLVNEMIKENNKLKEDNLKLRTKCSNLRTQRSCISKDILDMRTVIENVSGVLETASKSAYLTSLEKEEYKNIIEKLEIKKIFIENTLRTSLEATEEGLKHRINRAMFEKGTNLETNKKIKNDYIIMSGKLKEVDEKINVLIKDRKINIKKCDDTEEKLVKIKQENNDLRDCYHNKTRQIQQITKQIQEDEEYHQIELGKIKESIKQLGASETLAEKEIFDLNAKYVELNKQNCEEQAKIEQLNNECIKLQTKFEERSNIKQELENTMQNDIITLKNEASMYSMYIKEKEEELKVLKEHNFKLEQDQLVFRTQLEAEIDDSIKMEEEIATLQSENNQFEKEIKQMVAENEQITLKISDTEKEINRLRNCITTRKEELCSLKKPLEDKQKCYTEMMTDYSSKIEEAFRVLNSKKTQEDQYISNYMKEFEKITKNHAEAIAELEDLNEKAITKGEELEHELMLLDNEYRAITEETKRLREEKKRISLAQVQQASSSTSLDKEEDDEFYKSLMTPKKRRFDECSDSSSANTYTIRADEMKTLKQVAKGQKDSKK